MIDFTMTDNKRKKEKANGMIDGNGAEFSQKVDKMFQKMNSEKDM